MTIEVGELTLRMLRPRELAADTVGARASLDRLLEAVRQRLEPALARAFAWLEDDPRVIFIESLEFQLCVEIDRPPEELAAMIAAQITRRLHAKLADPAVVCFRDAAERLARFMLDLARGAAYSKPWHECFAGLKALQVSAILRTLIEAQPRVVLAALSRLAIPDREGIVRALTSGDAARSALAVMDTGPRACHDPEQIAHALAQLGRAWRGPDPARRLLLAAALGERGASLDEETVEIAKLLTTVGDRAFGPTSVGSGAEAADLEPLGGAPQEPGLEGLGVAGGLIRSRRELERLFLAARQLRQPAPAHGTADRIEIPRAGVWLLWPHVLEQLRIEADAPTETPQVSGSAVSVRTALSFAAIALAWGSEAREIWDDHGLRSLLDLPAEDDALLEVLGGAGTEWDGGGGSTPGFPAPELGRAFALRRRDREELGGAGAALGLTHPLARRLARLAYRALRGYAWRLPGFGASSNAFLRSQFLGTQGMLWREGAAIHVSLTPPPLDVVWRISGAGCAAFSLPDGTPVRVEVER